MRLGWALQAPLRVVPWPLLTWHWSVLAHVQIPGHGLMRRAHEHGGGVQMGVLVGGYWTSLEPLLVVGMGS